MRERCRMNQSFVGVHVARQISMWSIGASVATRCCRRRPSDRYGSDKRNKEIVTMKLVYKYALASPHENFDLIDLQMRASSVPQHARRDRTRSSGGCTFGGSGSRRHAGCTASPHHG